MSIPTQLRIISPQPTIYPLGIRIDEPVGTVTDLIIASVCLYAYYQLTKQKQPGRAPVYLRYYFLLMGVATVSGGLIGHGFLYAFSFGWKLPGWIMGMISVALIERSAIAHVQSLIKPSVGKFFLVLNLIELVAVMAVTLATLDFKWVQYHSGYGLLVVVTSFHAYNYFSTRDAGSILILAGVAITWVASVVYVGQHSIHTWYNYLDISHTLLALAAYTMYRGALLLQPRD